MLLKDLKLLQRLSERSLNDRIRNVMETGSYCMKWIRVENMAGSVNTHVPQMNGINKQHLLDL